MEIPLEISFHGLDHSDALAETVKKAARKIDRYADDITLCRVVIEKPHRQHRKGNHFAVSLDIHLRSVGDVVVNRDPTPAEEHADPKLAVRDAFDAGLNMLERKVGRQNKRRT